MCLAIPGRIVNMPDDEQEPMAAVEVSGVRRKVNVDLLRDDGLAQNDWVLIHVGFAMSKISEQEATEQLQLLETLGETQQALDEVQGYGSNVDPLDGANPFASDFDGDGGASEINPFGTQSAGANGSQKPMGDP